MTLTRLAFFKLVGAMGIGQAVNLKPNEICCPDNMGQGATRNEILAGPKDQDDNFICMASDEHGHLHFAPCACGTDEERCPMGHCQKPKRINGTTSSLTIYAADDPGAALGQVELHVCSVCGIVYVPITPAVPKGGH